MKIIIHIFILLVSTEILAAPVELDLSRSHTLQDVLASQLEVREILGGGTERVFTFKNQDILIKLPGGVNFNQFVVLGTFDVENSELTKISIYGSVMPHNEAVQIMEIFHETFDLPLDRFEKWEKENRGKVRNADPYSVSANLNYYPRVTLGVNKSMNGLYPWVIQLSISWDWDKHQDWDEARVWNELSALGNSMISLNPPSGESYERKTAYKEILKIQAEHERELAEEGALPPHLQSTPDKQPDESGTDTDNGNNDNSNTSLLIIIVGVIAVIIFTLLGVFYFFKAKR